MINREEVRNLRNSLKLQRDNPENAEFIAEIESAIKSLRDLLTQLNNKYYMDSSFTKQEVNAYNDVRDEMTNFCEGNGIVWRVMGCGRYSILENAEILNNIKAAGFPVKPEWETLANSEIEKYIISLGD